MHTVVREAFRKEGGIFPQIFNRKTKGESVKKLILTTLILAGQSALAADVPSTYLKQQELDAARAYRRQIAYSVEKAKEALRDANKMVNDLEDELIAMQRTDKQGPATQTSSMNFHSSINKPFEYKPQQARTGIRYVGVSR